MKSDKYKNKSIGGIFSREQWERFLDRHAFYVVLLLCAAIIGVTAIFNGNFSGPGTGEALEEMADEAENANMVPDFVQRLSDIENIQISSAETAGPDDSPTQPPAQASLEPKLMWPLEGEISHAFSGNKLVYSQTLREFRTHPGIDICGQVGDAVVAAYDGWLEEAYYDQLLGNVIVLSHENGVQTTYVGLSSLNYIRQPATGNVTIRKGQTLGELGTVPIEESEGPHLHFEMTKDGAEVDPRLYLERRKQ